MTQRPQHEVLLDLVGEVMALLDIEDFRPGLVQALKRAVPSEWVSLNEISGDGAVGVVIDPPLTDEEFASFARLAHENPLYQRWQRTRDSRAYRFSDVTTREKLESTRLWREFYRPLGVNHQIAFTLPSAADDVVAIALSREARDYSDAERELLDRARPFLIQAYRNALAFSGRAPAPPGQLEAGLTATGLTTRQAEIVALVARGASNPQIAARLGISDRTVQKHLERAFKVLGVTGRAEAAERAWELAG